MTNEEFWKLFDMQRQHEKELEAISEIFFAKQRWFINSGIIPHVQDD